MFSQENDENNDSLSLHWIPLRLIRECYLGLLKDRKCNFPKDDVQHQHEMLIPVIRMSLLAISS